MVEKMLQNDSWVVRQEKKTMYRLLWSLKCRLEEYPMRYANLQKLNIVAQHTKYAPTYIALPTQMDKAAEA